MKIIRMLIVFMITGLVGLILLARALKDDNGQQADIKTPEEE